MSQTPPAIYALWWTFHLAFAKSASAKDRGFIACFMCSVGIKFSDGNFGEVPSTSENAKLKAGSHPSSVRLGHECELIYNDNDFKGQSTAAHLMLTDLANQDAGARL